MSTKIKALLLLLFTSCILFSQEYRATIYFHDGVSMPGYAEIKEEKNFFKDYPKNIIFFRLTKDDKPDEWDDTMIDRIVFEDFGIDVTYQYVNFEYKDSSEKRLLEVITEGEVTLYCKYTTHWVGFNYVGNRSPDDFMNNPPGISKETDRFLWLKRKGEDKLTRIGRNKVKIAEYFDQCPGIVKKLKTNEFGYNNLKDVVEYYNDICVGYDDY